MQNEFQFFPTVVLCFILKNVIQYFACWESIFFLFFNLTQSLLLFILPFLPAEAGVEVGDEVFPINWCFLLSVSVWVRVTEGLAVR